MGCINHQKWVVYCCYTHINTLIELTMFEYGIVFLVPMGNSMLKQEIQEI